MKAPFTSHKLAWMFALCACIGAVIPFVTPATWWNLAFMPWYASWFAVPSAILYAGICLVFRIDFISDAGNTTLLSAITSLSNAIVFGIYGVLVNLVYQSVKNVFSRKEEK